MAWVGQDRLTKENSLSFNSWGNSAKTILLSSPLVTAIKRSHGLYLNLWVSYIYIIGVNENGSLVKCWVLGSDIRPVKNQNRAKASQMTDKY